MSEIVSFDINVYSENLKAKDEKIVNIMATRLKQYIDLHIEATNVLKTMFTEITGYFPDKCNEITEHIKCIADCLSEAEKTKYEAVIMSSVSTIAQNTHTVLESHRQRHRSNRKAKQSMLQDSQRNTKQTDKS